jgi:hypothetical protein
MQESLCLRHLPFLNGRVDLQLIFCHKNTTSPSFGEYQKLDTTSLCEKHGSLNISVELD